MPRPEPETVLCSGEGCPKTGECMRFSHNINRMKEVHLSKAPWDATRKKCEFYLDPSPTNEFNIVYSILRQNLNQ